MNPPISLSVMKVAALCVARRSVYHQLADVECFDSARDVRSFEGGMPVVCHAPCGPWSAYCAHQSRASAELKELGPLCASWLAECGGVLEHPAHSRLFDFCYLPKPAGGLRIRRRGELWSIEVDQAWWGYNQTKTTWLCFSGVEPREITLPLRLHEPKGDRRRQQVMSHNQRAATSPALAQWLVDVARRTRI
jgi:hypothetical protein